MDRVSAEQRRACVGIAVAGSLLVMAGVMLGFASQVMGLPSGWPAAGVVAWGLVTAGLVCGVVLLAAAGPGTRAGARRRHRRSTGYRAPQ